MEDTGPPQASVGEQEAEEEALHPNAFRLQLADFDGPLDLLLHLIQSHELDILDLPIAFVTEKYLAYLDVMQSLDLDMASDYLVMAATLAHIKSKMLLPVEPSQDEDDPEDMVDPREELVRRLLEYQKYKQAGLELASRGLAGRDVFTRGSPAPAAEGPPPLGNMTLFSLLDAFNRVLKRANADLQREITAERVSIQERITEVSDLLQEKQRVRFDDLFEGYVTTYDLVVTFLAMLEMAKRRLVRIYQSGEGDPGASIYLESALLEASGDAQRAAQGEGGPPQEQPEPSAEAPMDGSNEGEPAEELDG